jgi:hypothetical protein
MILKCNCGDHRSAGAAYQNQKYGFGRRVFNLTKTGGARCTVCLWTKTPEDVNKEKKSNA